MFSATTRAATTVGRRCFSIFNGTEQTILAVGTATREVNGKKAEVTYAQKFIVDPSLNIFSSITSTGGEAPVIASEVVLINKDGVSGVLTSVQPEADIKESKAAFTGTPFKWTAAKFDQVTTSGLKISTSFDFDKKPSIAIVVEKDGKVLEKTTGTFKVVNTSDYLPSKNQIDDDLAAEKARAFATKQ